MVTRRRRNKAHAKAGLDEVGDQSTGLQSTNIRGESASGYPQSALSAAQQTSVEDLLLSSAWEVDHVRQVR